MEDLMTYETRQIEISDIDYMGDYRIAHLLNRFSCIATENAQKLGLWNDKMRDQFGWVVAKQTLHLEKPIHHRDLIELSTIVQNGTMVTFPRYYFIKKEGQVIGHCSSIWTLIDIHKRRIIAPRRVGINVPFVEHEFFLEEPQAIEMNLDMKEIMTRKVLYSDVDTNQHMNNTRYIEWAYDAIDINIHRDYFVSDLTIQYKKEIMPMEDVVIFVGERTQRYIVEGRNQDNDVYFTIEIIFKNR